MMRFEFVDTELHLDYIESEIVDNKTNLSFRFKSRSSRDKLCLEISRDGLRTGIPLDEDSYFENLKEIAGFVMGFIENEEIEDKEIERYETIRRY